MAINSGDEVRRVMFGGFDVGDRCYVAHRNITRTECPRCNDGFVNTEIDGLNTRAICPHCRYGYIEDIKYIPEEYTIQCINYALCSCNSNEPEVIKLSIRLVRDMYDTSCDLEDIYKTLEECQVACDEKNKAGEALVL